MTFEEGLEQHLEALDTVLKSAKKGAAAAARAHKMLDDGDIGGLTMRLEEAEQELSRAAQGLREFKKQWDNSRIHDYFGSPEYLDELEGCLKEAGVAVYRLDDVLYVYPAIVRIDVKNKTVRIDKKSHATTRPSKLSQMLSDLQNRPSRFRTDRFLSSLFKIYKALASSNLRRSEPWAGKSLYLKDIYNVMSATPGCDYSEQEFARDIYLLDASGESLEVSGHVASFQASSGTRQSSKTFSTITRDGQKKLYCTIRFDPVGR